MRKLHNVPSLNGVATQLKPVLDKLIEEGIVPPDPREINGYLKRMVLKLVDEKTHRKEKREIVFYILKHDPQKLKDWLESGGEYGWACVPALKIKIKKSRWWREEMLRWAIPTILKQELFGSVGEKEKLEVMEEVGIKVHKTIRRQGYIRREQIIKICKKFGIGGRSIRKNYWKYREELIKRNYATRSQIVEPKANSNKRRMFFEKLEELKGQGVEKITMTELKIIMAEAGYSESTINIRKYEFLGEANEVLSNMGAQ